MVLSNCSYYTVIDITKPSRPTARLRQRVENELKSKRENLRRLCVSWSGGGGENQYFMRIMVFHRWFYSLIITAKGRNYCLPLDATFHSVFGLKVAAAVRLRRATATWPIV